MTCSKSTSTLEVTITGFSSSIATFTVNTFINPANACPVFLTCKIGGVIKYTSAFTALKKALLPRTSQANLLALKVITDPSSKVGRYASVTLGFTPSLALASGSRIVISSVDLEGAPMDCASNIVTSSSLTNTIACGYLSSTITITTGNIVAAGTAISVTINKLKYNSQKTAKSITLLLQVKQELLYCDVEGGDNNNDWKPNAGADLSPTMNYYLSSATDVCRNLENLAITITPTYTIGTGQLVTIKFNYEDSVSMSTGVETITVTERTATIIKGNPVSPWSISLISWLMHLVSLPSTEAPFTATITTYANNAEIDTDIVHQSTTNTLQAVKRICLSLRSFRHIFDSQEPAECDGQFGCERSGDA
jgi:hypothetical protein